MSNFPRVQLRHLSEVPITNGLGLPGSNDNPEWPRYIRTTDIASPTRLRDDVFASQPPEVAASAMVEIGDILMTAAGASIGKSVRYSEPYSACYAGFLVRLRPNSADAGRFIGYWMQSVDYWDQIAVGAVKSTIENFSASRYRALTIPLPPLDEQRAIADYLDQETAQIDVLVAKQEVLLSFLAERKRSVLDHVLASVSGARRRLRWLYRPSNQANQPDEEVLSVYREHGVIPKASRTDNFNKTPENVDRYLLVRPDDLVVNKMKAWQGSLGISAHQGIVSGDYEVLRPTTPDLDPEYAHFRLRSPELVLEYRLRSRGIRPSQWRLYWQDLADIEVVVPSLADQQIAASRIKAETTQIDNLISKAEQHIALAKERRSGLITAAVTGQFDVRTAKKGARV